MRAWAEGERARGPDPGVRRASGPGDRAPGRQGRVWPATGQRHEASDISAPGGTLCRMAAVASAAGGRIDSQQAPGELPARLAGAWKAAEAGIPWPGTLKLEEGNGNARRRAVTEIPGYPLLGAVPIVPIVPIVPSPAARAHPAARPPAAPPLRPADHRGPAATHAHARRRESFSGVRATAVTRRGNVSYTHDAARRAPGRPCGRARAPLGWRACSRPPLCLDGLWCVASALWGARCVGNGARGAWERGRGRGTT
jgi:hypothetical protein